MTSLAGFGRPALLVALVAAVVALILCGLGARKRRLDLMEGGIRALFVTAGFTVVAAIALWNGLVVHDFSYEYIVNYSSRSLTGAYTFAALWGGMEGSLLLWTLLLTTFSVVALRRGGGRSMQTRSWAGFVLAGISIFFLMLLVLPADPFTRLATAPADGNGLNPLLQSPGMLIHPPLLYAGFVGFSVPFAFAMGALFSGRLDDSWFTSTRRWSLFAWSALSIGIVLGGAWAYTELGWGGYWAWDPVENASFMPWLTATAFLHSVVIQEKRRMFKVWNVSLILLTYSLAVFGTFLTRSGILSSIHTFTEGPIGKWFLPFLGAMLIGGLLMIGLRLDRLRGENRFDSLLSRESAFLANNVLFVAATVAVLWGTIYPVIAELFTGTRLSVGPPFFNTVFIPIGLALILLTGLGPLIAWRRMSKGSLWRIVKTPLALGAATVVVLAILGVTSLGALTAFGLSAFTIAAIVGEFIRGSRVHRKRESLGWGPALVRTLTRNRRRYGGYVVHLGVVLIVIGFAGSAFSTERQALLRPGDSMEVGSYTLRYTGSESSETPEKLINTAIVEAYRGDELVTTLTPQRNFHKAQEQPQSEVAIRTNPIEDLYVVAQSFDLDDDAVALVAFVNPLTWWIWAGAGVMALGMLILLSGRAAVVSRATQRATSTRPAVAAR